MAISVECSNDPHTKIAVVDKHFEKIEEAESYFNEARQRFRAVWMSEEGVRLDTGESG